MSLRAIAWQSHRAKPATCPNEIASSFLLAMTCWLIKTYIKTLSGVMGNSRTRFPVAL
jgi:hypothetical protein